MGGGNNTIYFNNFLSLNFGGTLDLNGTAQTSRLFDVGAVVDGGGTIKGVAGSTFVENLDAARNFSGNITGAVAFQKTGANAALSLFSDSNTTGDILLSLIHI